MKQPKNDSRYEWTQHAWMKMQYYGISEGRVKRIVRFPARIEEGIADDTVAVMQPADSKSHQELWVMYTLTNSKMPAAYTKQQSASSRTISKNKERIEQNLEQILGNRAKKIRIITVWRYPGKSPVRDPIPEDVLLEIKNLL